MQSKYTNANGIRFHYVEQGTGELVVLLHGFPEFWYSWRDMIPELSKHYRVVAPDMRGYNLTAKPALVSDYQIEILAKDIEQLVFALGEKRAVIVGHDWGAAVAWAVASFYPEVVSKLVVMNVPHPNEMRRAFMQFNIRQWLRSWYIFFFQLPVIPEKVVGTKKFFVRTLNKLYVRRPPVSDDELRHYTAAYSSNATRQSAIAYYRAAFRQIFAKPTIYRKIKAPVLMLWGEQDKALGKDLTLRTAAYCENTCEVLYDPGSGHFVHQDNPEWVIGQMLRFVGTGA